VTEAAHPYPALSGEHAVATNSGVLTRAATIIATFLKTLFIGARAMRKSILAAAFAWACVSGLAASQAQTVHQVDFDPIRPSFGYSYAFSGFGDDMGNHDTSSEVSATYDVTTLPVGTGTLDSSDWQLPPAPAYTYIGWGLGIGLFLNEGTRPTSGNLSDYTVSFDASVAGYLNDGLSTEISVILQAPDDDDEDANAEEYRLDVDASLRPILTDASQTLEFNLGDLLPPTTPNFDFPNNFEDTFIMILQVAPNTSADQIGLDEDNVVTVDNIRFEGPFAVPFGGDFDFNDVVDGNDFLVWQRGESPEAGSAAELAIWKSNFGQSAPVPVISAVPEPCCLVLTGFAAVGLMAVGRRGAVK
jgi:hypothetical protein